MKSIWIKEERSVEERDDLFTVEVNLKAVGQRAVCHFQ